ncbi:hypothetical protein HPB50_000622 [Hyalomma asiaticum]|uniref:Uncharacterized protein n=1 Tax=Hyalomma asiaticum TaxID=266040 RepID=A0ACB7SLT6_HYAAI|nr:hypothetical protein HPB50_000622 [Hyalomma asiaticum]
MATNSRIFREIVDPLAADPGPDTGVVRGAIPGVHQGPGAVLGPVPAVHPPDVHRGATRHPVPGPAPVPVPGPTTAPLRPTVNDRRALWQVNLALPADGNHHRQATPARISEAPSLGRTPPREKGTLHHSGCSLKLLKLSASELHWDRLLETLERLRVGPEGRAIEELSALERVELVNNDPVACAIYTHRIFDVIMNILGFVGVHSAHRTALRNQAKKQLSQRAHARGI